MNHFSRVLVGVLLGVCSLSAWSAGGLLSQRTTVLDLAGPYTNYLFGSSGVSLSADGTTFAVADPGLIPPPEWNDGTGSGQLFQFVGGKWSELVGGMLSGPTTANGYGTGLALSADGSEVLFGFGTSCNTLAACVPVIARVMGKAINTGFYDPTSSLNGTSNFGSRVALSGDGHSMLVAAPQASVGSVANAGQVVFYTFTAQPNFNPPPAQIISDPAATAGDYFGAALALSADGKTALVGAQAGSGAVANVYVYRLSAGTWVNVATIAGVTGFLSTPGMLALSADGQVAIVASDTGANVYTASPGWSTYSTSPITVTNGGGWSVAIAADGSSVLVGTASVVYQYGLSNGSWSLMQSFANPGAASDGFGQTGVALSADKETMLISAGTADVVSGGNTYTQAGAVYVYQSPADLSITASGTPSQVVLDQQTTLAFTVTNNDTAVTAYNVVLTDTLPTGFGGIVSNTSGGNCSTSGQMVTCTLASLGPGATWTPTIQASVTTAGNYTDTASVTSNQPDPDTSNNSVNVSVTMVPPIATNGSFTLNADDTHSGSLTGSNPCNCGTPAYSIVQAPTHGTVSITDAAAGAFQYVPAAGYVGSDSFTFQLSNGFGTSATATESITVTDVPPSAHPANFDTYVNQPVSGALVATPGYAEQKLAYSATQPAHGSVAVTQATGAFTYTPQAGFIGNDSFSFTAGDGVVTSAPAVISIAVKDIAPVANSASVSTVANQAVSGTLTATPGYSGQVMSFVAITPPSHGKVSVTPSGAFSYTPNLGFVGSDSFTFEAGDGIVSSAAATITITVQDVVPTASNGNASTTVNQTATGTLSATPGYVGQLLSYTIVTQPAHGKLVLNASSGAFTYTPNSGYAGSDSFSFAAGDGMVTSATATVSVTVADVAPTANAGSVTTNSGQPVSGTLSATAGYSGQVLQYAVVAQPAHGSVTVNAASGAFTYTPTSGYSGADSFTFTVGDGTLTSAAANESVTVKAVAVGGGGGGGSFGLLALGFLGGLLGFARGRK